MNIFRLDDDVVTCARWHVDSHCVKMVLEYCQLLSTAHHLLGTSLDIEDLYKPTHQNHPSAIWVRETSGNYRWLCKLLTSLLDEYTHRYSKIHKIRREGRETKLKTLPKKIPWGAQTKMSLAMPEQCKSASVTASYRRYYALEKQHLLVWTSRPMPDFLKLYGFSETVNIK